MKLWLCVLSALLLAGCTAGTDVPGSVTPTAVPIHGCPSARNCGDCRDTAARRNRRGRGDARTHS